MSEENVLDQEVDEVRLMADGRWIRGASHTCRVLNHKARTKAIIKSVCHLRPMAHTFDSIVCCGTSGLLVAPQIAEILDKHIIVVRKDQKCYSEFLVEGVAPNRYIIIDDFICKGYTVRHIMDSISEDSPSSRCYGVYCYMNEECFYKGIPDELEADLGIKYLNELKLV
jgi:orotate phosphoribosyltransferase